MKNIEKIFSPEIFKLPEVYEGGHFVNIVYFGSLWLIILDEINSKRVGFVINKLKHLENGFAFNAILIV